MKNLVLSGFVAVVVLTGVVWADGKVLPVALLKARPSMPSQRAVVAYRDGVETMIVESAFEGEGEEFGWVIPVPSEPTEFEVGSAGLLDTLELNLRPRVTDIPWIILPVAVVCLVIVIFVVASIINFNSTLLTWFAVIAFTLVFFMSLLPSLGRTKGVGGGQSIEIVQRQRVGSFDLIVLHAESSGELDGWLSGNGFTSLNEKEKDVVNQYIEDGWCFVAAKLRKDEDGEDFCVPHPLQMTFTTERAVYPMKLTGTGGEELYLDLFVIGDERAEVEELKVEYSDQFVAKKKTIVGLVEDREIDCDGFGAKHASTYVGHPASENVMWDGCFVTRLDGELLPAQMQEDVWVAFDGKWPKRAHYFSARGALMTSAGAGVVFFTILLLTLRVTLIKNIRANGKWIRFGACVLLPSLLGGVFLFGTMYITVDKTEIKNVGVSAMADYFQTVQLKDMAVEVLEQAEGSHAHSAEYLRAEMARLANDSYNNFFRSEGIEEGDGPGDYQIFEDERGIVLRVYTQHGMPVEVTLGEEL